MGFSEGLESGFGMMAAIRRQQLQDEIQRGTLQLHQAAERRLEWEHQQAMADKRRALEEKALAERYKQAHDEVGYSKKLFELYPEPEAAPYMSSVERGVDAYARGQKMQRPAWMQPTEQPRPSPDFVGPMEATPDDQTDPSAVMAQGQEKALGVFKQAAEKRQEFLKALAGIKHTAKGPEKFDLQAEARELGRMQQMLTELQSGVTTSKFGFVYEQMNPGDRAARANQLAEQLRKKRALYQYAVRQRIGTPLPPNFNALDYAAARRETGATADEVSRELQAIGVAH